MPLDSTFKGTETLRILKVQNTIQYLIYINTPIFILLFFCERLQIDETVRIMCIYVLSQYKRNEIICMKYIDRFSAISTVSARKIKYFTFYSLLLYIDLRYTNKRYTFLLRIAFWMHPLWLQQLIKLLTEWNDDLWNQRCSHLAGVEDVAIDILHHGPHLLCQVLLTRHEDRHLTLLQCFQSYDGRKDSSLYLPCPIIIYWNMFIVQYWKNQKGNFRPVEIVLELTESLADYLF